MFSKNYSKHHDQPKKARSNVIKCFKS